MDKSNLHPYETEVLRSLKKSGAGRSVPLEELGRLSSLPLDSCMRACFWLQEKKFISMKEEIEKSAELTKEGSAYLESGFPEEVVLKKSMPAGGISISQLSQVEKSIGIPWAKRNEWIELKDGKVSATEKGRVDAGGYFLREALSRISKGVKIKDEEQELLRKRGSIEVDEKKKFFATLTKEGEKIAAGIKEGSAAGAGPVAQGAMPARAYDVEAPGQRVYPAKRHPLAQMSGKISDIFVSMGFDEMQGEIIESSFWVFDALFQPQDHPAREMADTFYLKMKEQELPNKKIVAKIKEAHEDGWGYEWKEENAKRPVLRTHTTAMSARHVSETGEGKRKTPAKYFGIGRVFRNEATDYKHLAEFHQVEGIVIWEDATFGDLLGLLKEFYRKLGFEKIRFRPSFFPYTEPSLEIEVYFEEKKAWMELGGAGIFRPEVCLPLWGKYPVLAWGLSLERPLMLLQENKDIRVLYRNDLNWLRNCKNIR